jgi:DNA-binding NtrC family response regulator
MSRDLGQPRRHVEPEVLELFAAYLWPGNVRELESTLHRALVLSTAEPLSPADFSWIALQSGDPAVAAEAAAEAAVSETLVPDLAEGGYEEALARYDRRLIEAALERAGGRLRETARRLGIARNTLKAKIERYGIETRR